jgi:hypothetical protein
MTKMILVIGIFNTDCEKKRKKNKCGMMSGLNKGYVN